MWRCTIPGGVDDMCAEFVRSGTTPRTGTVPASRTELTGASDEFAPKRASTIRSKSPAVLLSSATLGTPYVKAGDYARGTFGYVPVAYVKIVPAADFNIEVGKLYTLQGAENAFTFQNFDIERGLLFNQTSTINRGVEGNYAHG